MGLDSAVGEFLQRELVKRQLATVAAVEAGRWLDRAGLLKDSKTRPGLPLRDLLRKHVIPGQRQEPNGRWFIERADRHHRQSASSKSSLTTYERKARYAAGTTNAKVSSPQLTDPPERPSRARSDEAYVIDLCDEVLGQKAIRQHRFPWLLGDPGRVGKRASLPVDAYYPQLSLVIEYRERQHFEAVAFFDRRTTVSGVGRGLQRQMYDQRREEEIPRHSLQLVVISSKQLDADARGRLRRHRSEDLRHVRAIVGPCPR